MDLPANGISQHASFFGLDDRTIYSMAHLPRNHAGKGIILCAPFADEVQRSYRPLYNFANLLAANGYLALRFDYRGCGESQMEHSETSINTRLEDIKNAIDFVQHKYDLSHIGLLGLRLGGALAYLAASENPKVKALVLWEPVLNGSKYFYESLKLNLATQMVVYQKVLHTRQKLIEELETGKSFCIDGYEVGKDLYMQGCEISLNGLNGNLKIPTLFVNITRKQNNLEQEVSDFIDSSYKQISNFTHFIASENGFWNDQKNYDSNPAELFEATLKWLQGNL
jgi:alpha/beta superfamily hydrolase